MLALMKRLMNSIFGKIVVMIIIAGMAFWGADQAWTTMNGGLGSNLAAAGPRNIDMTTFDSRVENLLRNLNANAEKPITKSEAADQGIVDQVFQLEKSKIVSLGYASTIGVTPSTNAVVEQLKTVEAFKNPLTGELDLNTYREVLYQNRFTKEQYEQQVSDDLTLKTLGEAATAAIYRHKSSPAFRLSILAKHATSPGSSSMQRRRQRQTHRPMRKSAPSTMKTWRHSNSRNVVPSTCCAFLPKTSWQTSP